MTKAAELAKMKFGGRKNLVINGAMNVSVRSTSVTGLGDGDEGYVTVDRMRHTAAASAGRFTSAQTAISDLPGFLNCLHLDCTTADTDIGSSELLKLEYRFEGQDVQRLKKGTSEAEKVTVSFFMKTNKAFTFMCELDDRDNNRVNVQQFTTSTSFTRHVITFDGDTTGALDDDNNASLSVGIYLHAGSDFTGGTYSPNTWQSRASSDNMRAVGIDSFYDNTANDVKITGLQVEIGPEVSAFEHRSFGEEKQLCYRYCYVADGNDRNALCEAYFHSTTAVRGGIVNFPVTMRTSPTITASGTASNFNIGRPGSSNTGGDSLPTTTQINKESYEFLITAAASHTTGQGTRILLLSDAKLTMDSEL